MEGRETAVDTLRITLAAFGDIVQAREWYERQRSGLGKEFIQKVDDALSGIERNPLIYPELVNDARRTNMKRFPYGIWFKIEEELIIIAYLHHRRNPALVRVRAHK